MTKLPFPDNIIPTSRINANAALLLKTYFPEPNYSADPFRNYINNGVGRLEPRTDTVKIDHNFNERLRLSFVWSHDNIPVLSPELGSGRIALPGDPPERAIPTATPATCALNWTISPRTTNEVSLVDQDVRRQPAAAGRGRRFAGASVGADHHAISIRAPTR